MPLVAADVALLAGAVQLEQTAVPHLVVGVVDLHPVVLEPLDVVARERLREAWARAVDERVEVACGGGRGRTGTALACLAVLDGLTGPEAVAHVRRYYAPQAVETPWQRRFVSRFATRTG